MTNTILCFALVLVSIIGLNAQITLSTQAEVDAWDQNITVLTEDVRIWGTDITNINALINLTSIEGNLELSNLPSLANIDGLGNVFSITGSLLINQCRVLTSIEGLSKLSNLSGSITIEFNNELLDLNGLRGLSSIQGTLDLNHNGGALNDFSGLTNIIEIPGNLLIESCSGLTEVNFLESLNTLNGHLTLKNNTNLLRISGLNNLSSLSGKLDILSNENLNSISGLSTLNSIPGTISIWSNDSLTDLSGLNSVSSIIGSIKISRNGNLTSLNAFNSLSSLEGDLNIDSNWNLINLEGLNNLTDIYGNLIIDSNTSLIGLYGLENLSNINGTLNLSSNALTDLDALNSLSTLSGSLIIDNNNSLTNINSLSKLEELDGSIFIDGNYNLANCCGVYPHLLSEKKDSILIGWNASGCHSHESILNSDCGLKLDYEVNLPCKSTNNGEIKIYASNYDTLPFNYSITDINQQQVAIGTSFEDVICIEGLAEGTYSAFVTQPNGEEFTLDNIVLDPLARPSLDISNVSTTSSFNGLSNGAINLDYSGGFAPYTISLSGPVSDQINSGNTSAQFDNLPSGDYIIIVQDSDGVARSIELKIVDEMLLAEECSDPMDIIVLNLVSSAINANEYTKSKTYFQTFFESLNLGTGVNDSQIAVTEWAGKNEQDIRIPITGDLSQVSLYQDQSRSYTGSTDPLFALKFGYEYLLANGRSNAQKVIIFTYDGCPGFSAAEYCEELKENGVIIADIGIDYVWASSSYQRILRKAASRDDMAYFARNFDDLDPLELYVDLTFANCSGTTSNIYFDRDGSITIDNVTATNCPYPEFVEVTFTVASLEQLSIPIGTAVSFYHNNPTAYGASLISSFLIPCPIPAGESESFTISLPIETATHLFAVLNDDGETSPAFSLPNTDIQESLYSNNVDDERICLEASATLQALKSSVSLYPICEDIVQYTIDVCNISQVDALGVVIQDESPTGFSLIETIINTNNCSINNNGIYDIPADCCVTLTLSYNVVSAAPGYYEDQDVFLSGPAGQSYLDFDGSTTSTEDVILNDTEDCGTPVVTFLKEVNYATTCVDHSLTYTFTIDNQSSTPLYGVQFTDVLPAPLEWAYKPYDKQGLSITIDDFLEGQTASFTIDEIDAETTATFVLDAYVGYTAVEVIANNTARISGFPDYINNGVDFLESNTTTTTILGDIEIISIDTITVNANENIITLNTQVTPVSTIEWSSSGDGAFSDLSITDPTYTLGEEDRLDTLIGLFISVHTHCGQKGKSVFIKRACSLDFDPVIPLEVCEDETIDADLSWSGGIGPYEIDEISDVLDMSTSVGLSDLVAGTYNYTLNDAMGCAAEAQLVINSNSDPDCSCSAIAELGDDQEISCYQEIVNLDASASSQGTDYSYAWYDADGNLLGTESQYQTDQEGTYLFEITDVVHDCTTSQEILVTDIRYSPEANIINTSSILTCENDSIVLTVSPEQNVNYVWRHLTTGEENAGTDLIVYEAGQVQLEVQDTLTGCANNDLLLIEMDTIAPYIIIEDPLLLNCQNSSVNIDASSSDTGDFTWLDGDHEPLSESTEVLNTEEPGTFYFQIENVANGCVAIDSIVVISNYAVPTIEMDDEVSLSCKDEGVTISPMVTSAQEYELEWTKDQLTISNDLNLLVSESGTYIIRLTDKISACESQDTVVVFPANEISSLVISQTDVCCHGEHSGTIEISDVEGGTATYNYYLNEEPTEELKVEALAAGEYTIRVVDAAECEYDTLITLLEPLAIIDGPDLKEQLINIGNDLEVNIETNLAQEDIELVIWTPAIDCDNCLTYTFENVQEDLNFQITVIDKNNCEQSLELKILVDRDIAIYLPNVINPNTESNGVFFPQTSVDNIIVKEMNIYDRWGNLVFFNKDLPVNDPIYGWNGLFNNEPAAIGVYVYTIILKYHGETIQLSGDVTVLK